MQYYHVGISPLPCLSSARAGQRLDLRLLYEYRIFWAGIGGACSIALARGLLSRWLGIRLLPGSPRSRRISFQSAGGSPDFGSSSGVNAIGAWRG